MSRSPKVSHLNSLKYLAKSAQAPWTYFKCVNVFHVQEWHWDPGQNRGRPGGPVGMGLWFGGQPTPPGRGKGGPFGKEYLYCKESQGGLHFPSGLGLLPALHGAARISINLRTKKWVAMGSLFRTSLPTFENLIWSLRFAARHFPVYLHVLCKHSWATNCKVSSLINICTSNKKWFPVFCLVYKVTWACAVAYFLSNT